MTNDNTTSVASTALLACPYCQCPAILHHVLSEYWISCSDGYDCQFETDFHKTPEDAEAEWNALCEKANTAVHRNSPK
jgi:hypothetical protein